MLYKSSKGDRVIAEMPLSYAKNALNKLIRDEPGRTAEIEALQAHVNALEEQGDVNPRAVIGGNNPPEDTPAPKPSGRKAIDDHVSDLVTEAANWGDGVAIADQTQADSVGRLHRMLQDAVSLVNDAAAKEKKPHNDALEEIATWQNGYTAKGLKTKPDGKLTKALSATSNLSAAWLRKLDDERREREKLAAEVAQKAAKEALALREEAKSTTDLAVMDRAEDALANAKSLIGLADSVARERVRSGGGDGFRAMSLRSVWSATISSEPGSWAAAYAHYKTNPDFMSEFRALIQRWADRDVRVEATRVRGIPGFVITEEKVAA